MVDPATGRSTFSRLSAKGTDCVRTPGGEGRSAKGTDGVRTPGGEGRSAKGTDGVRTPGGEDRSAKGTDMVLGPLVARVDLPRVLMVSGPWWRG